jgi:hypothetical protein
MQLTEDHDKGTLILKQRTLSHCYLMIQSCSGLYELYLMN